MYSLCSATKHNIALYSNYNRNSFKKSSSNWNQSHFNSELSQFAFRSLLCPDLCWLLQGGSKTLLNTFLALLNYVTMCVCTLSHSVVSDSLWPHGLYEAPQAPLSMEFSRQEYWSGLPLPSPEDLPDPAIERGSLVLQALFTVWATREAHKWE